jgi:uncharacterized membrane protein
MVILKFLLRIILIPFYIIVIILGIIECFTIVLSLMSIIFFYEYLFDIKYTDTPFKGSEILWEKLNKLKQ